MYVLVPADNRGLGIFLSTMHIVKLIDFYLNLLQDLVKIKYIGRAEKIAVFYYIFWKNVSEGEKKVDKEC